MTDFLTAEAGIRQLHARYVDAVWRKDYVAFADCWTEDAEWRIGGMALRGREAITSGFEQFMDRFDRVLFTPRPPLIELTPEGANTRMYITEQNRLNDGSGWTTVGIYFERLAEQQGRWRRKWALFQLQYRGPADLSGDVFAQPDYGAPPAMPPLDAPTFAHARPPAAVTD
jgi:hypothetical protein